MLVDTLIAPLLLLLLTAAGRLLRLLGRLELGELRLLRLEFRLLRGSLRRLLRLLRGDLLRVAAEGKEQSLIGALDEDGELGWLEDDRDSEVAHFARKPWLAAMLHDSERNRAYARAIEQAAKAAPEGCVALEVGAGTGLLTQLLCKEDRIGHVVACEMEPALSKIAEACVRAGGFEEERCTIVNARSDAISLPTPASLVVGDSA